MAAFRTALLPGYAYTVLYSGTRRGRTRGWIFTVYASYDVFSPMDGSFGDCNNIGKYLGVIAPKKLPQKGRE